MFVKLSFVFVWIYQMKWNAIKRYGITLCIYIVFYFHLISFSILFIFNSWWLPNIGISYFIKWGMLKRKSRFRLSHASQFWVFIKNFAQIYTEFPWRCFFLKIHLLWWLYPCWYSELVLCTKASTFK